MKIKIDVIITTLFSILCIYLFVADFLNVIAYIFNLGIWLSLINELLVVIIFLFYLLKLAKGINRSFLNSDKNIKILTKLSIIYFFYVMLSTFHGFLYHDEIFTFFNTIRLKLFPILMGVLLCSLLDEIEFIGMILKFRNIFFIFLNIYIYINAIVIFIQHQMGWELFTQAIFGKPTYAFERYAFTHIGDFLRTPGLFSNALESGVFGSLLFIINIILYIHRKKIIYLINLLPTIYTIVLSYNRQIYIAILLVLMVIFLLNLKSMYIKIAITCFLISMFILVTVKIIPFLSNNGGNSLLNEESLIERTIVWNEVINDMKLEDNLINLFIGKGSGTSGTAIINPLEQRQLDEFSPLSFIDNGYLYIFHDDGLIGIGLFIVIVFFSLVILFKGRKKSPYSTISFLFLLTCVLRMFFNSVFTGQLTAYCFWIFLGLGLMEIRYMQLVCKKEASSVSSTVMTNSTSSLPIKFCEEEIYRG
ncbi:O-antigen ligase family protein [Geobacillus stearothermophilus]|uniref:O-antigen ligase family protein n=1 Tax=Geobacillus stearothermophilus TaxID=1422 RepID=UPI0007AB7977|nr:O-antigen ligase family protein [Geobacillus stearothermophilus]KZE97367.1 hypothetical protein AVP43_00666 [Geobacillus stearothermophilus]MED4271857.1 O-antigen ligase family protein [Geobacillus stearothermophilus]